MPMTKCSECGGSVSDRLGKCPHCGAVIVKRSERYSQFYEQPKQYTQYQPETRYEEVQNEIPQQKKSSKSTSLSVLAFIFSIMGFLMSFIAVMIAASQPKEIFVEKEVPIYTEENARTEFSKKDSNTSLFQSKNKEAEETNIEKQVVFDQDGIIITATRLDHDGSFMGPEIKFLIENNTEKNLVVQARDVSVNGYMVFTSMSAEVSSGKKINDSLTIDSSSLEESGIENIEYIDFSFHIFNDDSWDDSIDSEMIHIEAK